MSILVTGATGFIGRHLIASLQLKNISYLISSQRIENEFDLARYGDIRTIIHLAGCAHKDFSAKDLNAELENIYTSLIKANPDD
jgi:nucleoside-diphosphate-sugar epimerase